MTEGMTPKRRPKKDQKLTDQISGFRKPGRPRLMIGVLFVLFAVLTLFNSIESIAREFLGRFIKVTPPLEETVAVAGVSSEAKTSSLFSFRDLDLHPDLLFQPYLAGPLLTGTAKASTAAIHAFRDFLTLYEQRQAIDDNFTIRVVDNRTGDLLELFELESERAKYEERGHANWDVIDGLRRVETNRLVDRYASKGIPRGAITVKWGRKNQVLEARTREEAFIEYEIRLARRLGLSLLATEIGTVETFNQDELVSTVGARSRYQMMPYLLRQNGIHHYFLTSAAGELVSVFEEWNPLLTMEPSMLLIRGYANAVGHEIPGISAYHTGPGNIYSVYSKFLSQAGELVNPNATVLDAYVWAVTDGYDTVSKGTSFKGYSRGYVATAYGSLRATHELPIDTSLTMRTERVQLHPEQTIYLSELLKRLNAKRGELRHIDEQNLYTVFKAMNPHIELPESEKGGVPIKADIKLVSDVDGVPVRFFLPLGSSRALSGSGLIDESKTFRFDENTFAIPARGERTMWDDEYDQLVLDIGHFGFTSQNRLKLIRLKQRFEELAASNPSHYRLTQLEVIRTHTDMWRTGVWEKLASATAAVKGQLRADVLPVSPLPRR